MLCPTHWNGAEFNLPVRYDSACHFACATQIFPLGKNAMIEDALQFGAAVASARKALGLTQRELALAINSGERFIVELETDRLG